MNHEKTPISLLKVEVGLKSKGFKVQSSRLGKNRGDYEEILVYDPTGVRPHKWITCTLEDVTNWLKNEPLEEGPIADRLKNVVKNKILTAKDKVLYGLGSEQARGRLDLAFAAKQLDIAWRRYVGRESAAGDQNIKNHPTLRNLEEFLKFTFGFQVDDDVLERIVSGSSAGSDDGEAAEQQEEPLAPKKTADEHARDAIANLKATSPKEYEALRAKWKKPESVNESALDTITFDPQALWPKLANILIRNGLFQVQRGKETLAAKGRSGVSKATASSPVEKPENQTISARVSEDGKQSIDVNKMLEYMKDVNKDDMQNLKKLLGNADEAAYKQVLANPKAAKTMQKLVNALLHSIAEGNPATVSKASHSITNDGHTIDIRKFTEYCKKKGITDADIDKLKAQKHVKFSEIDPKSRTTEVMFLMANAIMKAESTPPPSDIVKPKQDKPVPGYEG